MKSNHKITIIVLVGIFSTPILICVGLILWSQLDAKLCAQRMAQNVGIAPTYTSIEEYILDSLKPGMLKEEVDNTLKKIAPIRTIDSILSDGDTFHQVALVPCTFALNNIVVFTSFDENGQLKRAWIDMYP